MALDEHVTTTLSQSFQIHEEVHDTSCLHV